uniref:Uncharacterized protein n=1 Tax=uncultured bacterium fosmid pJB83B9 TaxID=1478070 RepID=A0A0H3UAL1_9BACT|nr:hypothetical protein [uncultured bacterium fosmid pJB83B9]
MFDKMTWKVRLKPDEQEHVIRALSMVECTKGSAVYYQVTEAGKFRDIHAIVKDGKLTMRFSCHKMWNLWLRHELDNSDMFTMAQALAVIRRMLTLLDLPPERIKCDRFEVGLSFQLDSEPIYYIRLMKAVGESGKEFFIDALWEKNRQRTSIKTQTTKKVLKVYDKTFEAEQKGRQVPPRIIRVETIWKRQSANLQALIEPANISRLTSVFWRDWHQPTFIREIHADKGCKASQIEKATAIMTEGLQSYRDRQRELFLKRRITKKSWETIRTFCDEWRTVHCLHYVWAPGSLELEYLARFNDNYNEARKQ